MRCDDLNACADLIRRGDPDRFRAAMAAPPDARRVLFPIYAFNLEVARAPWVVSDPMLAQIRLKWWEEALAEIAAGGDTRRHNVIAPLAAIATPVALARLARLVEARGRDVAPTPFDGEIDLLIYLDHTAATLTTAAMSCLGAGDEDMAIGLVMGRASGLARFLEAVPELKSRGHDVLNGWEAPDIQGIVRTVLSDMVKQPRVAAQFRPAVRECWQARTVLGRALRSPDQILSGRIGLSDFGKRWRLMVSR